MGLVLGGSCGVFTRKTSPGGREAGNGPFGLIYKQVVSENMGVAKMVDRRQPERA